MPRVGGPHFVIGAVASVHDNDVTVAGAARPSLESGWRAAPEPILATYWFDHGSTGRPLTGVFQTLSAGSNWHRGAPGTVTALTVAGAVATSVLANNPIVVQPAQGRFITPYWPAQGAALANHLGANDSTGAPL